MKDTEFLTVGAWLQIGSAAVRMFESSPPDLRTQDADKVEHRFFVVGALGQEKQICDVNIIVEPGKSVFIALVPTTDSRHLEGT